MRYLSLILITSLLFCYSGVCSTTLLSDNDSGNDVSHCDHENQNINDEQYEPSLLIQNPLTTNGLHSECCYVGLTNSKTDTNLLDKIFRVINYRITPIASEADSSKFKIIKIAENDHDPPGLYLLASRFLL